jgi:hypothetical protein
MRWNPKGAPRGETAPKGLVLGSLQPLWTHNSSGQKTGILFQCPACLPLGSCIITANWAGAHPQGEESFASLTTLTLNKSRLVKASGCKFQGSIVKGQITEPDV